MALGTGPLAGLTLRRSDPLGVPLFGEHPFREIQPLLDSGEPRLNVLAPPYPLLQLVDCVRQVAPGPSGSAGPIRRSDPPGDGLADRDGHYDEPHTEGPL